VETSSRFQFVSCDSMLLINKDDSHQRSSTTNRIAHLRKTTLFSFFATAIQLQYAGKDRFTNFSASQNV